MITTHGAATKLGAPCVMHPHGLLPGIRWYQGTWLWPLQVVLAYYCNPKLSFSKSHYKNNRLKRVLLKTMDVLISKIPVQIPYFVLTKKFQNPMICQNKLLFGVKTTLKKGGFWKKFLPLTFSLSKLSACVKCFENLAPISKCHAKRCFKPLFVSLKNLRKVLFFQTSFS